ncbi:MAG: RagB/SusD family nutrient uptake outer membrane protein [Chryseolinea sp.]
MKAKIILTAILMLVLWSCDDQLDIKPKNILTNDQVFSNESAITAYMASLYTALPIEDFNFSANNGYNNWSSGVTPSHASGEALSCEPRGDVGDGSWWNWWMGNNNANDAYATIRNVNNFIINIPTANLTDEKKLRYLGEAMFLRAYDYFAMVKRYGGVPLITKPQNFTGDNLDELQVPRNTEKEIYDFIASQLDSAALLLPDNSDRGRANKNVALALKSRAMLYAGSEARYGSVQIGGLVGIASTEADAYFQKAFDAAKRVIESNKYSLYAADADKAKNFADLFLNTSANPEVILVKDYHFPEMVHSFDMWNLPYGVRGAWGYSSRMNPTLELVEMFEYADGSNGKLKITEPDGKPTHYANPADIYLNKDPRCLATIVLPFSIWRGTVIDIQAGVIDDATAESNVSMVYGRKTVTTGDYNKLYNTSTHKIDDAGSQKIISTNGIGGGERSITGFYNRKYMNSNMPPNQAIGWNSTQSWIDMRYAEVLLNYAEAAIELGDVVNAKTAVNLIRTRAGIVTLNDSDITKDRVRHERQAELALENHKYWDIRRWHTGDQLISNTKLTALYPYYDLQANSYVFTKVPVGNILTFWPKLYYEKIDPSEIQKNPKLVQNPLY